MRIHAAGRHGFASLQKAYLAELRARHRSPSTQRQVRSVLRDFSKGLGRATRRDVCRVSEADVIRFLEARNALSLGTRRRYLGILCRFFGFLEQRGALLASPTRGLRLPGFEALPRRVPSEAQVTTLLRNADSWAYTAERDRALLELLYGSGLRRSECSRLDLGDVDLAEGTLWVRNGKGCKDRVVPLTARATSALVTYLRERRPQLAGAAPETALFLSTRGGRRLTDSGLAKVVQRAARVSRLPFSAHSLRHACATHLLKGGADVRLIQELLGHKRLATTSLYTEVTVLDLKQAFERSHPRERAAKRAHCRPPAAVESSRRIPPSRGGSLET